MRSPMDALFDAAGLRCVRCNSAGPCSCWTPEAKARRREDALAYIAHVAETCGCSVLGGEASDCGCSPECGCHADEDTVAERGAARRRRGGG